MSAITTSQSACAAIPRTQGGVLMNLVVTLLAPLFLTATGGNIGFARSAAAETIDSYRRQNNADLITIALIVAFGLTALALLCQSTQEDLPITTALRLCSNANACNRSLQQNRRALGDSAGEPSMAVPPLPLQPETEAAEPGAVTCPPIEQAEPDIAEPGTAVPPPPRQPEPDVATLIGQVAETNKRAADHLATHANPARDNHHQAAWAAGAASVAAETIADLDNLSPEGRRQAIAWAKALNACANDLMRCEPAPRIKPGDLATFLSAGAA